MTLLSKPRESTPPSASLVALYTKIVETQARVNAGITPGRDWWEVAANQDPCANGKPINYWDAALDEGFEMFRSGAPFKWWSTVAPVDLDNTLVELVDVLHFLVSQEILEHWLETAPPYVAGSFGDPTVVARHVLDESWRADQELLEGTHESLLSRRIKKLVGHLALEHTRLSWMAFWGVAACLRVTPIQIAAAYFAKAELNLFRQKHGYKTGQYIKVWTFHNPGVEGASQPFTETGEDNKFLMDWVKLFTSLNDRAPDSAEIQAWLHSMYANVQQASTKA